MNQRDRFRDAGYKKKYYLIVTIYGSAMAS